MNNAKTLHSKQKNIQPLVNLKAFGKCVIETNYDASDKTAIQTVFYLDGNVNISLDTNFINYPNNKRNRLLQVHKDKVYKVNQRLSIISKWLESDYLIFIFVGLIIGIINIFRQDYFWIWSTLITIITPFIGYIIAIILRQIFKIAIKLLVKRKIKQTVNL